jgi:hypothetical protein
MYREWEKIEFQKSIVYEFGNDQEVDHEIDGKMK